MRCSLLTNFRIRARKDWRTLQIQDTKLNLDKQNQRGYRRDSFEETFPQPTKASSGRMGK
jgi:hypothetical protein